MANRVTEDDGKTTIVNIPSTRRCAMIDEGKFMLAGGRTGSNCISLFDPVVGYIPIAGLPSPFFGITWDQAGCAASANRFIGVRSVGSNAWSVALVNGNGDTVSTYALTPSADVNPTNLGLSYDNQKLFYSRGDNSVGVIVLASDSESTFTTYSDPTAIATSFICLQNGQVIIRWTGDAGTVAIRHNAAGTPVASYAIPAPAGGAICHARSWGHFWVLGNGYMRQYNVNTGLLTKQLNGTNNNSCLFEFPVQIAEQAFSGLPDPPPEPIIDPVFPTPVISNHSVVVGTVIEDFIRTGVNINGGCGAFNITREVSRRLSGEGVGMLKWNDANPNNPPPFRTDQYCVVGGVKYWSYISCYPNGTFYYNLAGPGDTNRARWVLGGVTGFGDYVPSF